MRILIILAVGLLATIPAWAASADLKPSQIFAADSPSIVVVMAYGKDAKAIAQGSGVVIAKDTVVSNCHVIEKATNASVLYQNKRFAATLRYEDVEHDLCSFTVKGLNAPPVRMGSTSQVQVGGAAYAIGAPEGLELTLSGGLISSLRKIPDGVVLQMTTPISPGSSGGGLFDSQGRLIGITSYYMKGGEQLNFALPVEWVRQLPQHGKLASANTRRSVHTANAGQKSGLQDGVRAYAAGDYAAALAIFDALAKEENVGAQFYIGWMYDHGYGVPKDYRQAVKWYRKVAEQGNAIGQFFLGWHYDNGYGVPQDYSQAERWYRESAEQGYAQGQSHLGMLYKLGSGLPIDNNKAVAWFRKAAAQGDALGQYSLGMSYATGEGVPKDDTQAIVWFRKAATQGFAEAQGVLGTMYVNGDGLPQDYAQAFAWYLKAAAQGEVLAQYSVGLMYAKGQGVPRDDAQAVAWWRKAAAQGNAIAQNDLGAMYEFGTGVPQDYVAAYALYNLSASLDSSSDNLAANNRSQLMALMTPEQVQAGQALTHEMQRIGVIKALDKYLNTGAAQPSSGGNSGSGGGYISVESTRWLLHAVKEGS